MINRLAVWLLMALWAWPAVAANARNPFQPPPVAVCEQPGSILQGWQLKGIIGNDTARYAWLVAPDMGWLRLAPAQMLLAGRWQVQAIERRQIALGPATAETACAPAPAGVVLALGK